MLIAGVREKVITPDFPTFMAGYPLPPDRYHSEVHDDIKAHIFYLKNHDVRLAIITVDLCFYTKPRVRKVRQAIEDACGIPAANIMISATHTHSAPVTSGVPFRIAVEKSEMYPHYLDWIDEQLVDGVREAMLNAFPAKIAMGYGHCGSEQNVGGNRRHKDGPADPSVWVTALRDDSDKLRGVLVNYALHPTFLHAESYSITADYPGYVYDYFQKKDPGLVVGFQLGAAGNQSSRHFRSGQTFEEAKRVGYALGAEAERVLDTLTYSADPKLLVRSTEMNPALKPIPTLEEAQEDQQVAEHNLQLSREQNAPYPEQRTLECTLIGANRRLKLAQAGPDAYNGYKSMFPYEIMLIGIGEDRIVSAPCEIFVEFGLRLKKESPAAKTCFGTVTNGSSGGYLYTQESYEEGGYEPLVSIYAPEAGDQVVEKALQLLRENQ
ncbi:MAG: hypothetical protein GX173_03570 [Ruminococcaceae bacterium]|jgi:hypothetical protein|nr:hypothetical protein [Oscillospiraceae bacterium]